VIIFKLEDIEDKQTNEIEFVSRNNEDVLISIQDKEDCYDCKVIAVSLLDLRKIIKLIGIK